MTVESRTTEQPQHPLYLDQGRGYEEGGMRDGVHQGGCVA